MAQGVAALRRGSLASMQGTGQSAPRGITFQPDIYPKVLSLLPAAPLHILDVGAGRGRFARLAADAGHTVESCDFQPDLYELPTSGTGAVPFHQADLNERIPLPDRAFDCCVSIEVIEHIEDHPRFIREVVRVTKTGGLIIITTPNVLSITSRLHSMLYGYDDCAPMPLDPARADYFMQHINPIALPRLLFLLEQAGAPLIDLTTNRTRRSAVPLAVALYPLLAAALRFKHARRKYAHLRPILETHRRWMLSWANLTGRIMIAVARRR